MYPSRRTNGKDYVSLSIEVSSEAKQLALSESPKKNKTTNQENKK
jgi:hypothetical protein